MTIAEEQALTRERYELIKGIENWKYLNEIRVLGEGYRPVRDAKIRRAESRVEEIDEILRRERQSLGPPISRALWLRERLKERGWNKHDIAREGGPHHKTIDQILNGKDVRPDTLEKLAKALSRKGNTVKAEEIPEF